VSAAPLRKYRTGGEIVAWCTKCRMDLMHTIVAMVDDGVKRVICKTCKGEHNYHPPKTEKPAAARRGASSASGAGAAPRAPSGARKTALERETQAARAERERLASWEKAIAGQPASAFRGFKVSDTYEQGQLVRHSKFGDGIVARVVDRAKVEILFQDGPRVMAHGMT
jgi:hypothetical protein